MVKFRKANANADFLSRQRGMASVNNISAEFPDEFPGGRIREFVFHIDKAEGSEFKENIQYLMERKYPKGLTWEEKSVFLNKVAP